MGEERRGKQRQHGSGKKGAGEKHCLGKNTKEKNPKYDTLDGTSWTGKRSRATHATTATTSLLLLLQQQQLPSSAVSPTTASRIVRTSLSSVSFGYRLWICLDYSAFCWNNRHLRYRNNRSWRARHHWDTHVFSRLLRRLPLHDLALSDRVHGTQRGQVSDNNNNRLGSDVRSLFAHSNPSHRSMSQRSQPGDKQPHSLSLLHAQLHCHGGNHRLWIASSVLSARCNSF